ncbi:aspartyl-phosphate phosphatase Spo0E family protein [Clostridium sp. YIM B02551]|uniref:aspartyl-phosphate phosphatase Spo0E family protein n=1 Tax=Clostridium sp. YIM B02551 TaxID=2910679 RepID=UPI001EEB9E48|nr:aspartyl-phosphate phosphatase Spo0E family protein [Clostridium sp. YIM B02551]
MKKLSLLIEKKREEVHEAIDMYGINDCRTLVKSQELDKLMAMEQKRRLMEC